MKFKTGILTDNFKNLQKLYFIVGGFVSVIPWHFLIVQISYFELKLDIPQQLQTYQVILFSNLLGTISNFFVSKRLFRGFQTNW